LNKPVKDRIRHEKAFYNSCYADPFLRSNKVNRFYRLNQSVQDEYRRILLENCLDAKVLEYGCGTGSYAFELAKAGAKVTAIDISSMALNIARARATELGGYNNIIFKKMNAEKMDFDDASFDLICGTGILHHLDLVKAILEIKRILKPGAKAIFIEPLGHNIFINIFRRFTPEIRSVDEHPLLENDISKFKYHFKDVKTNYYYLSGLLAAPFVSLAGSNYLMHLLESLDRLLFTIPFLRRQAWQVLIELSNPII